MDGQGGGPSAGVRVASTEATAQRILESASALFVRYPFDQVRLAAVADRSGVTVQTVIRRFGSKEQLYLAVARRRSEELRSARDAPPVGDPRDAIRALLEGYERWGVEILALLAQERRHAMIAEILDGARRYHYDWVARVFAPRLGRVGPAEERHELAKLAAATDLYVWKVLRHDLLLGAEQVRAAMTETVQALLEHTPG